ncbi:hypothetical protein NBRC116188_14720 [Oceaniserpentilla sp. 4NH20-0058]|uniref:hypothetical protein n=1 Tax=Oceaniserpentilla sp. 4NH20-0058 TaxID=3127660 RepID=UPI003109BF17
MYLNSIHVKHQLGLGLPSALFLILILTLLLSAMNRFNDVNAAAYGREWLSLRAFYVAESGAQIAAVYSLNSEQTLSSCTANFIQDQLMTGIGFSECILNVSCDVKTVSSKNYYTFTSEGSCGLEKDQAIRVVQIRVVP